MFRRVLNFYLTAIFLAGPGLCCCSLTRASAKDCTVAATRQITAHSCCHNNTDKQAPGKPVRCPCRQHQEQQVTSRNNEASAVDDQMVAKHWWPSFEGVTEPDNAIKGASDPNHLVQHSLDSPFPTSRDLLRALSVMRC